MKQFVSGCCIAFLVTAATVTAQDSAPSGAAAAAADLAKKIAMAMKEKDLVGQDKPLAVSSFANIGPKCKELRIGETVGELLTDALVNEGTLTMVDRANTQKFMEEMALGQTGLIDEGTAAQVGNLLGAKIMVTGSVVLLGDKFNVSARIVDVQSASMLLGQTAVFDRTDLVAEASKTQPISKHPITAGFKSLLIPGWGQIENDQVAKGTIMMILAGGAVVSTFYLNTETKNAYLLYDGAADRIDADKRYNDYLKIAQVRDGVLYGAAAVWAAGFFDAVVAAAIYNARLKKGLVLVERPIHLTPYASLELQGIQVSVNW